MEIVENRADFEKRLGDWKGGDDLANYPFVENTYAPFTPARRSLPLLNLGLISSAGAFLSGTDPFDVASRNGDLTYREIPAEIGPEALEFAARGYDTSSVHEDLNCQIPLERLAEYRDNAVIGGLNQVWWSINGFIPDASAVAEEIAPKIAERLGRYKVQAALLIPASRLCHQTLGLVARQIELAGIPTMLVSVDRSVTDLVRAPRTAYYAGEFGSVAGRPHWQQYQLRILDESLRWLESFDQPTSRKLVVELETVVETARGER